MPNKAVLEISNQPFVANVVKYNFVLGVFGAYVFLAHDIDFSNSDFSVLFCWLLHFKNTFLYKQGKCCSLNVSKVLLLTTKKLRL